MQVIKPNGETETLKDTSLAGMQKAVGGYIEMVPTNDARTLIVNEEGLLEGLEPNPKATELTRGMLAIDSIIVGNVIIAEHNELD